MEHTMKTVGNIVNTLRNLDSALKTIASNDDGAAKAREGIKDARNYIVLIANADREFGIMCTLYKEMLDRGLASIDISDDDFHLETADILSVLEEFGMGRFTMSMSNKYTTVYAADFCNNGFTVTRFRRLNDGKYAFEFERK